jgi:hypothetical protein
VRFEHKDCKVIVRSNRWPAACWTSARSIGPRRRAVHRRRYVETLPPGQYAFWKGVARAKVVEVDLRETTLDVSGQEIMTADKVTLR